MAEIIVSVAFLAFIAWFPLAAMAIDRAYSPRFGVEVHARDSVTVGGVEYRRVRYRWHNAQTGREMSVEASNVVEREVRAWLARQEMAT